MRRPAAFAVACAWGTLCGAALGALRTREAALHLLAKNRALLAAGQLPLPGNGHWDTLASGAPALAGALFFGLSLGLGAGALSGLWFQAAGGLPNPRRLLISTLPLAAPAWAAFGGDWGLAGTLLAALVGAAAASRALGAAGAGLPALTLACAAAVSAGVLPWALAPEGGFVRLRDRFLLRPGPGLRLDEFYYRWTLYPAEALKPPAATTQPTAAAGPGARDFCRSALALRILCVPVGSPGADLRFEATPSGGVLASGRAQVPWPEEPSDQRAAWTRFSRLADTRGPLREATGMALFAGCPVALVWSLGSLCVWLGARLSPRQTARAALSCAGCLALALGVSGAGKPLVSATALSLDEVRRDAASASAPLRLRAVVEARRRGPAAEPVLLAALRDPVVNIRYLAAESLGAVGGPRATSALMGVLEGDESWYVKERAYAALWRLGWRPGNP